jgi:hypothetical protein
LASFPPRGQRRSQCRTVPTGAVQRPREPTLATTGHGDTRDGHWSADDGPP